MWGEKFYGVANAVQATNNASKKSIAGKVNSLKSPDEVSDFTLSPL